MRYAPHDYQTYAIDYIKTHPIATVFLDMGLGKTSITLTAINDLLFDSFEVHKVLVIAPLRVARDTWTAEVDKWDHLQNLSCSVAVGTDANPVTPESTPSVVIGGTTTDPGGGGQISATSSPCNGRGGSRTKTAKSKG